MLKGTVIRNDKSYEYFMLEIEAEKDFTALPGQFVMVQLPDEAVTIKPFSLMAKSGNYFTLFVKKIGKFTTKLANLKSGDSILFRGGYGIPYHEKINRNKKYFLIGGGSGAAPLMYFESEFPEMVAKSFYGFKNSSVSKIIKDRNIFSEIYHGKNIIEIANEFIRFQSPEKYGIILCGPIKMVESAQKSFNKMKVYVSLEERMGCGIGMCMGCPVKTKHGIKKVCKDGPLFDLSEVMLKW